MAKASERVEVRAPATSVLDLLLDLPGWSGWMPGVASAKVIDANNVEWAIQTPAGEVVVPLEFVPSDNEIRFARPADEGPFRVLQGRISVEDVDGATAVSFEMEMETQPPGPPAGIVSLLVAQALATLSQRVPAGETPSETAEPELLSVPMSDGASISVLRYAAARTPAPAVLLFIPYRKESTFTSILGQSIAGAGFDFLVADVRGFGGSKAKYEGLLNDREVTDGVELIAWTAEQDFCTGSVATMGASYTGANQVLFASRKPPALKCIAPWDLPVDTFRDWTHRGGIPSHTSWGAMTYTRSQHPETARVGFDHYYQDLILDPLDNDGHRRRSPEYHLSDVDVPTLCMGGWHDYFLRGTLRTYLGVSGPKRLVVGPWGHAEFTPRHEKELINWLKFWLDGEGEDPTKGKRVHLYVTGADEWTERDDWPVPSSQTWMKWHPQPEQKLAESPPDQSIETRVVPFVESIPMALNVKPQMIQDATDSGMSRWGEDAVFDAEPMASELTTQGFVSAVIKVTITGCEDFDAYARLSVVTADGSVTQLTEGRLRASHRELDESKTMFNSEGEMVLPWHPHTEAVPLPTNEPIELAIEMGAVSHQFSAGERIRLGVTLARSDDGVEIAGARIEPESRLIFPTAQA